MQRRLTIFDAAVTVLDQPSDDERKATSSELLTALTVTSDQLIAFSHGRDEPRSRQ
jgi:hypothetical protein